MTTSASKTRPLESSSLASDSTIFSTRTTSMSISLGCNRGCSRSRQRMNPDTQPCAALAWAPGAISAVTGDCISNVTT
eukprot:7391976-Prymnesium_polylepis.3